MYKCDHKLFEWYPVRFKVHSWLATDILEDASVNLTINTCNCYVYILYMTF